MKKHLLTAGFLALWGVSNAQQRAVGEVIRPETGNKNTHRCATVIPSAEWDNWFNGQVEKFNQENGTSKLAAANYTIPVIVHILHNGDAAGVAENIAASQVASQITVLNNDFGGTGAGTIPSVFTAVNAGNTGVQFCLAVKDPNGNTLSEPGIERINWTTKSGWQDPNGLDFSTIQDHFDNVIKPQSIWDPAKYLNIWVASMNTSGLLGYASWPSNSTLSGLSGVETATTSGVVINYQGFGTTGTAAAPYAGGRTATHEIGHWLGLRHISGDASCGNDFCNDTPPQKGGYSGGQGGLNWGCPPSGWQGNGGLCTGNTSGQEMFMNYMDYCDDACLSMFSADQKTRIQTAMANATYRKFLGTHGLCSSTPQAPVANFTFGNLCSGQAATFTDASANQPTSWAWSVNPSSGVTLSTASSQNPSITFPAPGTYTVSLTATNTIGNNSTSQTVTVNNCTVTGCDTLSGVGATDTLVVYRSAASNPGYVSGNNGYDDREKAQYFSSAGLTSSQITGGIVLFYKNGTKGTTATSANVKLKFYNGNNTSGPSGAEFASVTSTLSNVIAASTPTTNVTYCGDPAIGYSTAIIYPYKFSLASPAAVTGDFIASLELPANGSDTAVVFMTSGSSATTSTAWEKWSDNTWNSFTSAWTMNSSLAILPLVNCGIGIQDEKALANNIGLFPNPSKGNVTLALTLAHATDVQVTVGNMMGQMVHTQAAKGIATGVINLDLQHLAKGVYMVTVTTAQQEKVVKKIVIE